MTLCRRSRALAVVAIGLFSGLGTGACGGASVRSGPTAAAGTRSNDPAPPKVVTARSLRPSAPGGLGPGTAVSSGFTGVRVFANPRVGFAITELPRAGEGTYPVRTADGGKTWRTDGPVLHVPAAQGPLAVDQAGVLGPRTYFAWCGACNTVIDDTPDAGMHWWQTFMPGDVLAVLGGTNARSGLTAIVDGTRSTRNARGAWLWVYSSPDGRRWTYDRNLDAVS